MCPSTCGHLFSIVLLGINDVILPITIAVGFASYSFVRERIVNWTAPGACTTPFHVTKRGASGAMGSLAVFLATANVLLRAENGTLVSARALCHSGSQVNLVTAEYQRRLGVRNTVPKYSSLMCAGVSHVSVRTMASF